MQMVINGRFAFPSTNFADPVLLGKHQSRFATVVVANQQLQEYEEQVARLVQDQSAAEDPLMVFELDGIARQPPPAILEHLHTLDRKFRLGVRLRKCRSPDFLMEMVAASDSTQGAGESSSADSAWWIADIVCDDFDTVQYLPHGCLSKLLLLALRGRNASLPGASDIITSHPTFNPLALRSIIPRLLVKLREYFTGSDPAHIEIAANIVLYYLENLGSPDLAVRHVASQVLYLLTSSSNTSGSTTAASSEAESASTPLTSDLDSIEDEITAFDSVLGGAGSASMSFGWISDLAKFPCYAHVRPKIFSSLEGLLERESSVPALRSCIKALYDFWNEDTPSTLSDDSESREDTAAPKTNKTAIEKSLMLAGAYGKLLSGREFVGKLLLKDQMVFSTVTDVMWRVIELQLMSAPQLKANVGISFSDCKVFYVGDGSNAIREIKLPLPVIHGAILALCSPHARGDGVRQDARIKSSDPSHCKLAQSLFPRPTTGTAILSSTGLIATKDSRLYPDHLLAKLAASSSDPHLCRTTVRAMTCDAIWRLLLRSALQESCFSSVVQSLLYLLKTNEGKLTSGLTSAAETSSLESAATFVISALTPYKTEKAGGARMVFSSSTMDKLADLEKWLHAISTSSSAMDSVHDHNDQDEDDLLSEGFAAFSVATTNVKANASASKPLYSAEPSIAASPSEKMSIEKSLTYAQAEIAYFSSNYTAVVARPSGEEGFSKEESVVTSVIRSMISSCQTSNTSVEAASVSWGLRMSLLHYIQSSCPTHDRITKLAHNLLDVVDHVCQCTSASHRQECSELIQHVLQVASTSFSYTDTTFFIDSFVNVCELERISSLHSLQLDRHGDMLAVLGSVASFIKESFGRWKEKSKPLVFEALTTRGIVVLLKDIAVLQCLTKDSSGNDMKFSESMVSALLLELVGDTSNEAILVEAIDAVVSSTPTFKAYPNDLFVHDQIRRDMIGVSTCVCVRYAVFLA